MCARICDMAERQAENVLRINMHAINDKSIMCVMCESWLPSMKIYESSKLSPFFISLYLYRSRYFLLYISLVLIFVSLSRFLSFSIPPLSLSFFLFFLHSLYFYGGVLNFILLFASHFHHFSFFYTFYFASFHLLYINALFSLSVCPVHQSVCLYYVCDH